MKYLGLTVLVLVICGSAFWGGMEFQRHRQSTQTKAPSIFESAPAPAAVKKAPMTGERATEIAVAHMQQSQEGDDYYWTADPQKIALLDDIGHWRVPLEAHPKPAGEIKVKVWPNGRRKAFASVRLTTVEVTPDGKIDQKKWSVIFDW